jgi:hypothetical protein
MLAAALTQLPTAGALELGSGQPSKYCWSMRSALLFLAALELAIAACARTAREPPASQPDAVTARPPEALAEEIRRFEAADRATPPQPRGVLFVGSSSIRLWPALEADFPCVDVLQRGFGGSELSDVVRYAPRIVLPYQPRLIVLYAGDAPGA